MDSSNTPCERKVLVGMSGGIDSSAVCMLLQEKGYHVIGMTLRMHDLPGHFSTPGQTDPNHVLEARALARKLGIPHYTYDVREDFRSTVIQNFMDEYLQGRTPNPCVMCNLHFKWRYLMQAADEYGCDKIATGHYARIEKGANGYLLKCGLDVLKDQSYFLWRLGQKELGRTLFPLGGITKEQIKEYVLKRGFKEKVEKKESMEICFIEKDYRDFLLQEIPDLSTRLNGGYFVDEVGRKIGQHKGFPFYTVGQRKGLEIALGYPAYVIKINAHKNTIRLGKKEELDVSRMLVDDVILNAGIQEGERVDVRIRYRSAPIPASLFKVDGDKCVVKFATLASAITPGQSAVFYKGDTVVGGGIITDNRFLKKYRISE
ncbi:tRNA 2-thiouridine(34) synthase MnmA [Coprobacter tertius]|uniref:tRNA-specific 2-thiouridylase MnmA n=1 Tax=Coprobacter tertius TaxID=2944915 RepID=A0ABT1MGF6_9BACT|nr:tRNA 2-thiouridine(34) synthase MnmA [Coprobacter tertius]MCP9610763.1 tRNA 2-thiouridine(34) synthase MnmA [Coprobacter tertius]